MIRKQFIATLIALPLLLAACDEIPGGSGPLPAEAARLTALGYKVTGRSADGTTTVLRYSGPVNASVRCGQPSGSSGVLKPRIVAANGQVQEFKLNTHLVLSSTGARDGLYVLSRSSRPSAQAPVSRIESIAFAPGSRGTFLSGLSCQAT